MSHMKRCRSVDFKPTTASSSDQRPAGRQHYKGRLSLQQQPQPVSSVNQSHYQNKSAAGGYGQRNRRRRYRMKSPRRQHKADFLFDEMDEICTENFQCLESTDDYSSAIANSHSDSSSDKPLQFLSEESAIPSTQKSVVDINVLDIFRNEMDKFKTKKNHPTRSYDEDEQRHKFGDVLWLHLQTFFAGRQMDKSHIRQSLNTQDRTIIKQRQQKMKILNEILSFKSPTSGMKDGGEGHGLYEQVYDPGQIINVNVQIVGELLNQWEELAALYPHSIAMHRAITANILDGDELFKRIDALQVWLNITRLLLQKINDVGIYFGQIDGHGRHRHSSSNELLPPSPSSPSSPSHPIWPWPELDPTIPADHQITELLQKILGRIVGRSLRLRGMISVLRRLQTLTKSTLERACFSLLQPRLYSQIASKNGVGNFLKYINEKFGANNDSSTFAVLAEHRQHFCSMQLPSFRPHFQFLLRLPIEMVIIWLKIKSEKVISTDWDLLTLDTLVEDSHDCLDESIRVKNHFLLMWNLTNPDGLDDHQPNSSTNLLAKFDEHLEVVFQNYLSYIRLWNQTAAKSTGIEVEKIVTKMLAEWENARKWGEKVPRGELALARMFCNIGQDLLDLMVRRYMNEKFDSADLMILEAIECKEDDFLLVDQTENIRTASSIFLLSRAFKEMIRQLRERSLRSLAFIRELSNSLEFCARYDWQSPAGNCDEFVQQLLAGGRHVVVSFPDNNEPNFFLLCSREMANQFDQIDHLLLCLTSLNSKNTNINNESIHQQQQYNGRKNKKNNQQQQQNTNKRRQLQIPLNYLLLIPSYWLNTEADEFPEKIMLKPSLQAWNTLQHLITPKYIYLIAGDRTQLEHGQRTLATLFTNHGPTSSAGNNLVLIDDFCSCNDELAEEINELKSATFECVREVWACSRDLGEYVLNGKRLEDLPTGERASLKGTLLLAWTAVFECQKELSHFVSIQMHAQFFTDLLTSVRLWTKFIESINLDDSHRAAFDQLAILSKISKKIFMSAKVPKEELEEFVALVRTVTGHVHSLDNETITANNSEMANELNGINGNQNEADIHIDENLGNFQFGQICPQKKLNIRERIKMGVEMMDAKRQHELQRQHRIGHVLMEKDRRTDLIKTHFFTPRKAPFEWQRLENSELGSGSFGNVFLAMNLRDKFLLAVKQIQVRHDNEPSLRAMIDEVEILQKLNHPSLIKYFGVEVHKTEVLIFMEYCSEGTLARVCRERMDLPTVRRYTHYLFQAIAYIHEYGIVHRDIKTANIFLAAGDKLKLGDFGCSSRLDGTKTMAGEMLSYVGTIRYMAPEIQTNGIPLGACAARAGAADGAESINSKGYGRAVDIWSGGCVVLEMLTGKKPFHYLNHEFQVIYQLGMGIAPRIPPEVQRMEMAYEFLRSCFIVEAQLRPQAKELLQHPFANIIPQELSLEI